MRAALPVLVALHNPALRERHWTRVQTLLGNIFVREELLYGDMLAMGVGVANYLPFQGGVYHQTSEQGGCLIRPWRLEKRWQP